MLATQSNILVSHFPNQYPYFAFKILRLTCDIRVFLDAMLILGVYVAVQSTTRLLYNPIFCFGLELHAWVTWPWDGTPNKMLRLKIITRAVPVEKVASLRLSWWLAYSTALQSGFLYLSIFIVLLSREYIWKVYFFCKREWVVPVPDLRASFSKAPETFRARKLKTKSRTLRLQFPGLSRNGPQVRDLVR